MPSQLGTIVQLNATGTATNQVLLALVQRVSANWRSVYSLLGLVNAALNNLISGATTANVETALAIPSGQGGTYFNNVNGALAVMSGTSQAGYFLSLVNFSLLGASGGTPTNLALFQLCQQLQSAVQVAKSNNDLLLGTFNDGTLNYGNTPANMEGPLGLITGHNNGVTLFNMVNGASQAYNGNAENSQMVNLAAQVMGP